MLHAGLDLSRKRLDVCVLDADGAEVLVTAVAPDGDALRTLTAHRAGLRPAGRPGRPWLLRPVAPEGDLELPRLVAAAAPQLVARPGIGTQIAGQLLVTAGDNPTRLRSEGAFAMLVGTAPIPASSGKIERQRLNRGGDR